MSNQNEVYATFCGLIDQQAVHRLFQGIGAAMLNKASHIHLLFQSTGGAVSEGVCLYNYFRTLPIKLTLYNVGSITSIAVIAYLGANERKTSAHATFMVHRSQMSLQAATATRLQSCADALIMDDQRTETILRKHLTMPEDRWNIHRMTDLWFTADDAERFGLATAVEEFSPPAGTLVYNV